MGNDLAELYKERAELAEMESECEEAKKYARHGGFWWRIFNWLQRGLAKEREAINIEIAELTGGKDGN
jgi:hypothetical protein